MAQEDIFDRFSESAKKILTSAQTIAREFNSGIDSEHILIALASTPGTLGHDLLKERMISADQLRLVLSLRGTKPNITNGISPEAKRIIKIAYRLAGEFNHIAVDSEHILLAIISQKSGVAYQLLSQLGVDPEEIKNQIIRLFDDLAEMDKILHSRQGPIEEGPGIELPAQPAGFPPRPTGRGKQSALDYFATNLNAKVTAGEIDPVIGRDREINRAIQILARRTKNNPVFIGEPGVGKTALVEGLATRIVQGQIPQVLKNKKIYSLDLSLVVAGTMYRGQFEERLKKLIDEIIKDKNIIVFIDELHSMVGAGSAEGSLDAANILKPALAKGQIRLIGATTIDEFRKHIEKDAALERRLQSIMVNEPTISETYEILKGLRPRYAEFHNVKITDEALKAAAELSGRFITDRFLPDKAIDLIDEAAAAAQIAAPVTNTTIDLDKLQLKADKLVSLKEREIVSENFERAAKLRDEELKLKSQIKAFQRLSKLPKREVNVDSIAEIVSSWTGIPIENIIRHETEQFLNLEKSLSRIIVGQADAIKSIAQTVRRSKTGLSDPNRPLGSFIFLGSTGVGKTELAKVMAREIYGSDEALVKIDMSEFMERHNVSRLLGAPPGYVGYEDAGKLTEKIRRQPYSIVLFDEIEKAHPEVFNILLQILEDGYITDSHGRRVSFRNTIIIMTSNIGLNELNREARIGFGAGVRASNFEATKEHLEKELQRHFRPEFLNRIDQVVIFKPLSNDDVKKIVEFQLELLKTRIFKTKIELKFSDNLIDLISKKGYDPDFGARPVRRAIINYVENPLSELLLKNSSSKLSSVSLDVKAGKVVLNPKYQTTKTATKTK